MSDETRAPEMPGGAAGPDDLVGRLIWMAGMRPAVPHDRLARLRAVVHAHWRETVTRDRRRGLAALIGLQLATAAAVAALAGAGYWLRDRAGMAGIPAATITRVEGRALRLDGRAAEVGGVFDAGAGLTTGPGARVALQMTDGASLRVDAGSDLRFAEARVVRLERGAVYVDTAGSVDRPAGNPGGGVAPRATLPIEIRTRLGTVSDVGTQFEVRLAGDLLQVSVRAGVARLTQDGRVSSVPAGTRLRVDRGGTMEAGTIATGGPDWDWVQAVAPPFDLEGRTLDQYLEWLGRETGWRVVFADPSIAASSRTVALHGSTSGVRPVETPDAVLPACGLRHRVDGGTLVIERAGAGAAR